MDIVAEYLEGWQHQPALYERAQTLLTAYLLVRQSEQLGAWRFAPGRRKGLLSRPMYCAFAATPYTTNDWFVLRAVEASGAYSIGFVPDYGVEDSLDEPDKPATLRRRAISEALVEMERKHQLLPYAPFPRAVRPARPHAYKGFEWKLDYSPPSHELAQVFIRVAVEWERLFSRLL